MVKVTFWDDFAALFADALKNNTFEYPLIIIVCCGRPQEWQSMLCSIFLSILHFCLLLICSSFYLIMCRTNQHHKCNSHYILHKLEPQQCRSHKENVRVILVNSLFVECLYHMISCAHKFCLTNITRLKQPEFEEYNKSFPQWKPIEILSIEQIKNVKAEDSEVNYVYFWFVHYEKISTTNK